jgi:membrane protein DedA with SNARE-associated domain
VNLPWSRRRASSHESRFVSSCIARPACNMLALVNRYGYLAVFFGVMLESAGLPLPGDTVLLASGVLVHEGVLDLSDALFFGILGAVVGDQIGYWAGRFGGRPFVLRWGKYAFITSERLGRAETFFARHGGRAVFLARFITGLRVFAALVAGISRMPWGKFALYNVLGGTAWATAAVTLGYFLWASVGLVEHWVGRFSLLLVAALVLAVLLRWAYRKAMRTRRGEESPDGDKRAS